MALCSSSSSETIPISDFYFGILFYFYFSFTILLINSYFNLNKILLDFNHKLRISLDFLILQIDRLLSPQKWQDLEFRIFKNSYLSYVTFEPRTIRRIVMTGFKTIKWMVRACWFFFKDKNPSNGRVAQRFKVFLKL